MSCLLEHPYRARHRQLYDRRERLEQTTRLPVLAGGQRGNDRFQTARLGPQLVHGLWRRIFREVLK